MAREAGSREHGAGSEGPAAFGLRVVLVRPRNPDNVGAVARALKNFGVRDWVLVAPGVPELSDARKMAVHAEDLLERVRIAGTLGEAVSDCAWIVGTSS